MNQIDTVIIVKLNASILLFVNEGVENELPSNFGNAHKMIFFLK